MLVNDWHPVFKCGRHFKKDYGEYFDCFKIHYCDENWSSFFFNYNDV